MTISRKKLLLILLLPVVGLAFGFLVMNFSNYGSVTKEYTEELKQVVAQSAETLRLSDGELLESDMMNFIQDLNKVISKYEGEFRQINCSLVIPGYNECMLNAGLTRELVIITSRILELDPQSEDQAEIDELNEYTLAMVQKLNAISVSLGLVELPSGSNEGTPEYLLGM